MPRIRCHYLDCIFNEEGICTASKIELDPDTGCLTYSQINQRLADNWDDDDDINEDWDDIGFEDDDDLDDVSWLDEDDDFDLNLEP